MTWIQYPQEVQIDLEEKDMPVIIFINFDTGEIRHYVKTIATKIGTENILKGLNELFVKK